MLSASFETSARYITFGINHSAFKGQLCFFLQLHPNDFCFGFNMLWLFQDMIESIFFMQLQLTLTMFLLNILCILLLAGKCFTRKWRKFLPMFVFMLLEYGGLNHIMSLLLVLWPFSSWKLLSVGVYFNSSLKPLSYNAFW